MLQLLLRHSQSSDKGLQRLDNFSLSRHKCVRKERRNNVRQSTTKNKLSRHNFWAKLITIPQQQGQHVRNSFSEVKQFFNGCLKNILCVIIYVPELFATIARAFSQPRRRNDLPLSSFHRHVVIHRRMENLCRYPRRRRSKLPCIDSIPSLISTLTTGHKKDECKFSNLLDSG